MSEHDREPNPGAMRLTLGVVAEAANATAENKLNILGEFNLVTSSVFPVALASLSVVLRLEAPGHADDEHVLQLRLVDQDGDLIRPLLDLPFRLGQVDIEGLPRRAQFIIPIALPQFEAPGTYVFDVLVDGQRPEIPTPIELHVRRAPETGQGGGDA
jgi:hypothetical protein